MKEWIKSNLVLLVILGIVIVVSVVVNFNLKIEINIKDNKLYIMNQVVQTQYSGVNIQESIQAGLDNHQSNKEIVNTILALKDKSPDQGKDYLISKDYSRLQVASIYNR